MLQDLTNWRRLYGTAALVGAAFGLLLALGILPTARQWPGDWGFEAGSPVAAILLPVAAGVLVALVLTAAAHLGARWQLRRRSKSGPG